MLHWSICFPWRLFFIFSVFFFKQRTAYEVRIRDWSSDVCSSDLSFPRKRERRSRATATATATARRQDHQSHPHRLHSQKNPPTMHPALSVIFFTTLSGAGYGLLAWLGVSIALLNLRGQVPSALVGVQLAALLLGLVLSTIGLLISLGHLGKPLRAWRAFSQWRTSWLSREGVMSIATLLPALAVGALLWRRALDGTIALVAPFAVATWQGSMRRKGGMEGDRKS